MTFKTRQQPNQAKPGPNQAVSHDLQHVQQAKPSPNQADLVEDTMILQTAQEAKPSQANAKPSPNQADVVENTMILQTAQEAKPSQTNAKPSGIIGKHNDFAKHTHGQTKPKPTPNQAH